jgi:hypothetical protein
MLPNFIVIGAMKSGTTSLHHYLNLHPEISMSNPKEIDFFSVEGNWKKGLKWYENHFTENTKLCGESSTSYTKYPTFDGVAERMYSVLPNAKLIYLIRDPIERIVSHYIQNYSAGRENRTISEALKDYKNNHYINCSKYYYQLQQYLKYYNKTDIMIITSNDLLNNRRKTLKNIFQALKVDDLFYCSAYSKVLHKSELKMRKTIYGKFKKKIKLRISTIFRINQVNSSLNLFIERFLPTQIRIDRPRLEDKLLRELIKYLKDDITNLRKYSGMDFSNWSV